MEVSLVLVKKDGRSQEVPVRKFPLRVGRHSGMDLRVENSSVSRRHCELVVGDDELVVRDLGSSNGTFVNGRRVKESELSPGDLLALGEVVFVVRVDGFPKMIDAASAHAEGLPAAATAPAAGAPAAASPTAPKAQADSGDSSIFDEDFFKEDEEDQPRL